MLRHVQPLYSRLLCSDGLKTAHKGLSSTTLRRPTEVLLIPPSVGPPPARVAERTPASNKSQWKRVTGGHPRMDNALSDLQQTLRIHYQRKIHWPTGESDPLQRTSTRYLETLMQPVVDMFNQLSHQPDLPPIQYRRLELDGAVEAITFRYGRWSIEGLPILLQITDNVFSVDGNLSNTAENAVAQALAVSDTIFSITISNFSDTAVCFPSRWDQLDQEFVELAAPYPLLALRIVATAGLCHTLPYSYLSMPDMELSVDESLVLPQGPPQNPESSLLNDADVFATHRKNSDFDRVTLVRDRSRALQFFRWHKHMKQGCARYVARPGDILPAATNDNGILYSDFRRPIYPFDSSRIPADTAAHLRNIQRVSPLGVWQEVLQKSRQFSVKIRDVLSEGSERSISSVYRCDIVDIDGTPIPRNSELDLPPSLCLKLFDDLYQDFENPLQFAEELQKDENIPRWFDIVQLPEWNALSEALAYEKLSPVQGSTVPWFYGVHQIKLGDGRTISGLLMEYVEGEALNSSFSKSLSEERKIHMIKSCRHAARILDIGDVSQRDWHEGQLLLRTDPITGEDHAVLIDFALTTQTYEEKELNYIANYLDLLTVLSGFGCKSPFERSLVWKHFGEPDDWDAVGSGLIAPGSGLFRCEAKDMFPFITVA